MRALVTSLVLASLGGCERAPEPVPADRISTFIDPDTGCRYIVVDRWPGSSMATYALAPKFLRDGTPDCPGVK